MHTAESRCCFAYLLVACDALFVKTSFTRPWSIEDMPHLSDRPEGVLHQEWISFNTPILWYVPCLHPSVVDAGVSHSYLRLV